MQIIFLGTSHGVPEKDQFCSCTLVRSGENSYLVDAGAPVSSLLNRSGVPHESVRGVFITHLHGDHFNGLAEFCDLLTWHYTKADPLFLLPEQKGIDMIHTWVSGLFPSPRPLRMRTYSEGIVFDDGRMKVTARRTRHTGASFAFVLELEGKRLLFTGDMSSDYSEYPELHKGEAFDLVVCEGAHRRPYECYDLFAPTRTKQMVINHCAPRCRELAGKLTTELPFPCRIAFDGLTLSL